MHITPFDLSRLFSWFWGIVYGASKTAFDGIQVNALAATLGITQDLLTIALGIYGLMLMLGLVQAPVANLVSLGLRGAVVFTFLAASTWNYWVRDLVTVAVPAHWAQVVSFGAADGTGPASPFDTLFNQANAAGWDVMRAVDSWWLKALVILYFVVAFVAIGCGFGIWAEGALMAAFYVAVGPLTLPCAFFKATRPIFTAWCGITASAVVLQLLALAVAGVLVRAETAMLAAITSGAFGDAVSRVAALCACALIFFLCARWSLKMPAAAAQLCGGIYWHPAPLIGAAYDAVGKMLAAPVAVPADAAKQLAGGASRAAVGAAREQARRLLPSASPSTPPGPSISRSPAAVER